MNKKILLVDDDRNLLNSYQRTLRKDFEITTAEGGPQGLEEIKKNAPYAVIISDMRMPGMDGVQFLVKVKTITANSVRMMLTGNADLGTAVNAINEGNIFRFMLKPCSPQIIKTTIESGLEQYRLIIAEKELLEKTLRGSIKILTDVLSITNPKAFSRSTRIVRFVHKICNELNIQKTWQIEIAAMLCQIGCVAIPEEILEKAYKGLQLTSNEKKMISDSPKVGKELIANIPRMETIADIIAYQEKHYDGTGNPEDNKKEEEIPLGARILKVAQDYDTLIANGMTTQQAFSKVNSRHGWYDPKILTVFAKTNTSEKPSLKTIPLIIEDLKPNMVFSEDVHTKDRVLLVAKGQQITPYLKLRLKNYNQEVGVIQPLHVYRTN